MTKVVALFAICVLMCLLIVNASVAVPSSHMRTRRLNEEEDVAIEDIATTVSENVPAMEKADSALQGSFGRIYIPEVEESEFVSVEEVETEAVTAAPTETPTFVPTTTPTAIPTAPTAIPTAIPTFIPTRVPTAIPTPTPTGFNTPAPTAAPTAPTPIVTFSSNLTITGLSSTTLTTNDINTILNATAVSMKTSIGNLVLTNYIVLSTAVPSATVNVAATTYSVLAIVKTSVASNDPTGTYNTLVANLNAAVSTTFFTNSLRSASNYYDAPAFSSASCNTVTNSPASVSYPPSTDNDNNDDGLTDGQIAGIVIGTVFGAAILAALAYYFIVVYRGDGYSGSLVQSHNAASNKASNDVEVVL